ncbi:tRNA (N6-isopentenyl adenosine(37)-C2)-methylthiotransferase MiaB [Thermodesulforhabdus norvegica]|uniref:tRNA-2-methylthio-N(6)-dimethylallyladenosine synthase n=1 Tax=Thermodesulforhabdus norvegica TaxID=39841 RepID=A0A1I4STF0_9BACT|nr:tRNA (N6-isopentenyl adenosine(37)-C2)-methylthiotransferase MiaB [Thermodesulforhabdus norvegica]SFM67766.1 tRNA-i(6)A37 thiotransferase enzyme MiaB [Thermodesulforhabdus norvegica]
MRTPCAELQTKGRLYVHTFGCQMNEYDSLRVQRMLSLEGYELVDDPSRADVIFINTCSVREKAEQKLYSLLGRLKNLKKKSPHSIVAVGGCVAEQVRERIFERFPHVDIVVGTRGLADFPRLVQFVAETRQKVSSFPEEEKSCGMEWLNPSDPSWNTEVVAPVTIMQGCNNFCTYCIVPYVRGRERSRPVEDIINEIEALARKGAREVLLLGQNVNSYGKTLNPPVTFADLLRQINHVAGELGILRVRFTTSHPKDLTEDLMACFRDLETLCPQIHLPFQAGSDRILRLMNRKYTQREYLGKIDRLRSYRPDIAISADVMVGFPGETEADFRETMKVIETVRFDGLFSFRYSDRPFTVASRMEPKVDDETKTRWLVELQQRQAEITLQKNKAEEGLVREVLVEGRSKAGGTQLTGRTPHGRIVNFDGPEELVGKIVAVRIVEGYAHSLKGELIDNNRVTNTVY